MKRFVIEEELGQGGMGVVYRAFDTELERRVAIKFLRSEHEHPEGDDLARFKREVAVLVTLSHPNIVKLFDAGHADDRLYYVMELLEAKNLRAVLNEKGPLPVEQALDVLDQMLDALEYLHEKEIVHRDIKPANIMLESSGRAILMDFGLVRRKETVSLTDSGQVLGTPRYLAPELLRGEKTSPACDLWSLGITAFELLANVKPFQAESLTELAARIVQDPHPRLEKLRPALPRPLVDAVDRLLVKDPAGRWPSAKDARHEFARIAELPAVRPGGAQGPAPRPRPWKVAGPPRRATIPRAASAARPRRWGRLAAIAGAAGLLVVLAVLAGLYVPVPGNEPLPMPPGGPESLSMRYVGLDRLGISFTTPTTCAWQVEVDATVVASEHSASRTHRIVVPVAAKPPEKMALVQGSLRIQLRPPPAPVDLVARLRPAIAKSGLDERATDRLWSAVRTPTSTWPGIPAWSVVGEATSRIAARAVAKDPRLAGPLDAYVARLKRTMDLGRTFDDLRPLVGTLLAAPQVADGVKESLLASLGRLDLVDVLFEYVGLVPPFGVQESLRGAVTVEFTRLDGQAPLVPDRATLVAQFSKEQGMAVFHRDELPGADSLYSVGLLSGEEERPGVGASLEFDDPVAAGPSGKKIQYVVLGLAPQIHTALRPPGLKASLPIRIPAAQQYGPAEAALGTIVLGGALAGKTGRWTFTHQRAFRDSQRPAFSVAKVWVSRGE